jgi:hypothetical protein
MKKTKSTPRATPRRCTVSKGSALRGYRQARRLFRAGLFIAAIKHLRDANTLTLRDAKNIVEAWMRTNNPVRSAGEKKE